LARRAIITVLGVLAVTLGLAAPAGADVADFEADFLSAINAERAVAGLAPLQPYWDLVDDARAHSALMASTDHLHHNPGLATVTTGWSALGENVGVGPGVDVLHDAFMRSSGHRANILGSYNYAGVGVVVESEWKMWVTVVFMRGPAGLGSVESTPPSSGGSRAGAVRPPVARDETVGLVDTSTGIWHLLGNDGNPVSFYYGNPGDHPMVGDWDCDGIETPGLYRRSDGYVYLRNSNTQGVADIRFYFGNPSDIPLAGDFDGDGCDTVSIYRPGESRVYVINRLGAGEAGLGAADYSYDLGRDGDTAVVGDFDGDGIDSVGVFRPATGEFFAGAASYRFGRWNDLPVVADWNGDGTGTLGVYRPSSGEIRLRHQAASGDADEVFGFSVPAAMPVAGDFGL
jgi:hypothetical protein